MNRKFMLAPLLLATMTTFAANAAGNGMLRNGSMGANSSSLPNLMTRDGNGNGTSSLADMRGNTLRDRLANANTSDGNSAFGTANLSRSRTSSRSDLPGLGDAGNSDSALADSLPKVETSGDSSDGKITRSVDITGQNGKLSSNSSFERTGQSLKDISSSGGDKRSVDGTLKMTSDVSGNYSRSGDRASSDSSFNNSSSTTLKRSGSVTPASSDSLGSSEITRSVTSDNSSGYSVKRDVAGTDNMDGRTTKIARDTSYGLKSSSTTTRDGVKTQTGSREFKPEFNTDGDRSTN
jgi:hypothetical protein